MKRALFIVLALVLLAGSALGGWFGEKYTKVRKVTIDLSQDATFDIYFDREHIAGNNYRAAPGSGWSVWFYVDGTPSGTCVIKATELSCRGTISNDAVDNETIMSLTLGANLERHKPLSLDKCCGVRLDYDQTSGTGTGYFEVYYEGN